MQQFEVRCGKDKVKVQFVIGCFCITYMKKNYLVHHDAEDGWLLKVGTMDADCFAWITDAIEEHIMKKAA